MGSNGKRITFAFKKPLIGEIVTRNISRFTGGAKTAQLDSIRMASPDLRRSWELHNKHYSTKVL